MHRILYVRTWHIWRIREGEGFVSSSIKRISFDRNCDFKREGRKEKGGKISFPMWEEAVFTYSKANQKEQKQRQTLGICSSQQGNSNRWCMILETKINSFPSRQSFALLIHLFLCRLKLCLFTPGAIIIEEGPIILILHLS